MTSLENQIREDLKQAMLAKRDLEVSTLRLILSAVKNREIAKGENLTEEDVFEVIKKEAKQRRESIEGFEAGGRKELVEKETKELEVLKRYLPNQLSEEETRQVVRKVILQTGAREVSEMGRVIGAVMAEVKGKADGSFVSKVVREELSK
jgi:uncharacterized protein YqeY